MGGNHPASRVEPTHVPDVVSHGTMMKIVSVEVIDRDAAWPALTKPIRVALRLLTVEDFLRIRFESLPTNRDS